MSGDWQRESATPRAQRCKFTHQRRNRVIMKHTDKKKTNYFFRGVYCDGLFSLGNFQVSIVFFLHEWMTESGATFEQKRYSCTIVVGNNGKENRCSVTTLLSLAGYEVK